MANGKTRNQYFAGIVVNIATFVYGCSEGWVSPYLIMLQSSATHLNAPLTDDEVSWVGGILCLGALTGAIVFMYLVNVLSRKTAGLLIAIPSLLQWIMMLCATEAYHIYISRFLGGMGGGASFVVVPVMVTEFAEDHVRGSLGSLLCLVLNFGIVAAFFIGSMVPYHTLAYIMIAFPVLHAGLLLFLPETPTYLLNQGKTKEALESLRWYRCSGRSDHELSELTIELEKMLQSNPQNKSEKQDKISFKDFRTVTPLSLRGLMIGLVLQALQQACGLFAIMSYASTFFQEAGSSLSPNVSTIIMGSLQFVGTYISTLLVDRAGRKFLLITSCLGTGIGLLVLAIYSHLKALDIDVESYRWIPVTFLSICVLFYAIGLGPLPIVVASEVFSPKIRAVATPFCVIMLWIFAFILLRFYNNLNNAVGVFGSEYIFSGCMAFGAIFIWLGIPETKGRSIEDILEDLSGKKKNLPIHT